MTKKSTAPRQLPADLDVSTLQTIQDLHSEMLATASDLGYEPPNDCLVEIEEGDEEAGREIVKKLHAGLTEHHERVVLADQGKKSQGAAEGDASKSPRKSKAELMADQKAARLARDAAKQSTEKEPAVADTAKKTTKKPAAKKTAAKKTAKKATPKKAAAKREAALRAAPEGKISWIHAGEGNGTREGTGRHERRELLRKHNGKTVKTYLENGGSMATLNRAVAEKAVRVVS